MRTELSESFQNAAGYLLYKTAQPEVNQRDGSAVEINQRDGSAVEINQRKALR